MASHVRKIEKKRNWIDDVNMQNEQNLRNNNVQKSTHSVPHAWLEKMREALAVFSKADEADNRDTNIDIDNSDTNINIDNSDTNNIVSPTAQNHNVVEENASSAIVASSSSGGNTSADVIATDNSISDIATDNSVSDATPTAVTPPKTVDEVLLQIATILEQDYKQSYARRHVFTRALKRLRGAPAKSEATNASSSASGPPATKFARGEGPPATKMSFEDCLLFRFVKGVCYY